jgi:hypothetical protein
METIDDFKTPKTDKIYGQDNQQGIRKDKEKDKEGV